MRRTLAFVCLIACCATVSADSLTEAEAKVAVIYRLAWYVQWPALPATSPLTLCLVGADPFGRTLDVLLADKRVQTHPITIRRVQPEDDIGKCQVLFIATSEESRLAIILAHAHGLPVLTVSDLPSFAQRGGMIELFMQGKRLRFAIEHLMVEASGLQMSSEVLKLAKLP